MQKTVIRIGAADHGRLMALEDFDHAQGQEGYLYELSRGVIVVSDVPNWKHGAQVDAMRQMLALYRGQQRTHITSILGGGECKILLPGFESERHPDIAIYKHPPATQENFWATWIPDIAVEVVSPDSEHRDYVEKREEYLQVRVREYWIIDADRQEMLVLRRRGGRWTERVVRPPAIYRTKLLPGFELSIAAIFEAANAAQS